jgi:hypothetical protein
MSWAKAQEEAAAWLRTLPLPASVKGDIVDLRPHLASLKTEGGFRHMVLRAADRALVKRGAIRVIVDG